MAQKRSLFIKNLMTSTLVILLLFGLCVTYLTISQYKEYKNDSQQEEAHYLTLKKNMIKARVEKELSLLAYNREDTENRLKKSIKTRVYEAHTIGFNIVKENVKSKSEPELMKLVKDALRPIRFNNNRGYFFAVSLNGIEILYPTHPEYEGTNVWELKDARGKFVIQEEIRIVQTNKEGFVYGYWPEPGKESSATYLKISFVKKFEPFDWLIGAGEYIDDVEKEIQQNFLTRITNSPPIGDEYFFIVDFNGKLLAHGADQSLIGQNMGDIIDDEGTEVGKQLLKAQSQEDGVYVTYQWPKPSTGNLKPKISYFKRFKNWHWIIGTGTYLDDIDIILEGRRSDLRLRTIFNTMYLVFIFLVTFFIASIIIYYRHQKMKNEFKIFESFFKQAATEQIKIDSNKLQTQEFDGLSQYANIMTDKIISEKQNLERLSITDSLTQLFNRKKFDESLEREIKIAFRYGNPLSLIMFDIDNFKNINDTHGHHIGDEILSALAAFVKDQVRETDIVARWGGEEFMIILPQTELPDAFNLSEKLRKSIEVKTFPDVFNITASFGVTLLKEGDTKDMILKRVDIAMYQSKKEGKNKSKIR